MGKRGKRIVWESKKVLINGVPIEEIPLREAAIHYDDDIVKDLCGAIMCQAIRDWHEFKKRNATVVISNKETVTRKEVSEFFNSTFCGNILSLIIAPDVDIGMAVRSMDEYNMSYNRLGWGRGQIGDTIRKDWEKNGKYKR